MQKATRKKNIAMLPFNETLHPTREQILKSTRKYQKALGKSLKSRLESEQAREQGVYDNLMLDLMEQQITKDQVFS